jgi:uncharacterized protein (TIGR00369 family)
MEEAPMSDSMGKESSAVLQRFQAEAHRCCFCRRPIEEGGLGTVFTVAGADRVEGTFTCDEQFQSYDGIVHGGIIATLLDGAMTNCLLARGLEGRTAELTIRYRDALLAGVPAKVVGERLGSRGRLHRLRAEIVQNGAVKAEATAKFMV